jgi:hypothetical protein
VGTTRSLDQLTAHSLAQFFGHSPQVSQRDVSRLVVVEQVEDLLNVFFGVLITLYHAIRCHAKEYECGSSNNQLIHLPSVWRAWRK